MTPAFMAALIVALGQAEGPSTEPRIEKVERLAGNVRRPLLWTPLAVTLASRSGFRGDLVARSSYGFSIARGVEVAPGGRLRVILPAIDPEAVTAGPATFPLRGETAKADFVVGVDARLPYAADLASDDKVLYAKIEIEDLRRLLAQGLLEALDLLLLADASGLPLGAAPPWAAAPSRAEAERAVTGLKPPPCVEAVDLPVWDLAPRGGWVPAKKDFTLFFTTVYAFAAFVALVAVSRRHARFAPAAGVGVAALFVGAYFLFFPRDQVWIVESACEVVPAEGDAADWRIWFAGAAREVVTKVQFPRLVKPVFPEPASADLGFTIRAGDRGCDVEGLKLIPARSACFAGVESQAPTFRALGRLAKPLYRVSARIDSRWRALGDLAADGEDPLRSLPKEGPEPRDAEYRVFRRFAPGDALFGWLNRGEQSAKDVSSPDLADARLLPRYFIQRLR